MFRAAFAQSAALNGADTAWLLVASCLLVLVDDGTIASLEEVLRFYAAGGRRVTSGPHAGDGRANPYKSDLVARIDLSEQEQADIVAFLKTLTDHEFLTNPKFADPFK